jgi:hypothetical protein
VSRGFFNPTVAAMVFILALSGCSSAQLTPEAVQQPTAGYGPPSIVVRSSSLPIPKSLRLFASSLGTNGGRVDIFKFQGTLLKKLAPITAVKYPWGLAMDGAGTLYVTDRHTNAVYTFPKGSKKPSAEFDQPPTEIVNSVAVGPDDAMYVADYTYSQAVVVYVYPKGKKKYTTALWVTQNVGEEPLPNVGVDSHGTIYVVYGNNQTQGAQVSVTAFKKDSSKGNTVAISGSLSNWSGQATFDKDGDLIIPGVPQGSLSVTGIYKPGNSNPSRTIQNGLQGYSIAGGLDYAQKFFFSSDLLSDLSVTDYHGESVPYVIENPDPSYPYIRGLTASP